MSDAGAGGVLKIITVCSHNRTRSVMTMAMMQRMFDDRLGEGVVVIQSLGFGPEDMPSIPDAVAAMKRRGLDTSDHRSRQVTEDNIEDADLVLTSERDHVVKIAAVSPVAYRRSMTMPEFLSLAADNEAFPGESVRDWVTGLTEPRTARDYITGDVAEIFDPTGSSPRAFEKSVVEMEAMCEQATRYIAAAIAPEPTRNRFDFD